MSCSTINVWGDGHGGEATAQGLAGHQPVGSEHFALLVLNIRLLLLFSFPILLNCLYLNAWALSFLPVVSPIPLGWSEQTAGWCLAASWVKAKQWQKWKTMKCYCHFQSFPTNFKKTQKGFKFQASFFFFFLLDHIFTLLVSHNAFITCFFCILNLCILIFYISLLKLLSTCSEAIKEDFFVCEQLQIGLKSVSHTTDFSDGRQVWEYIRTIKWVTLKKNTHHSYFCKATARMEAITTLKFKVCLNFSENPRGFINLFNQSRESCRHDGFEVSIYFL